MSSASVPTVSKSSFLFFKLMPPKKKPQSSTSKEQCCVCCQPIAKGKDESLFCGGDCQQWLHRYCAGVSKQVFNGLAEEGSHAFFCFACCLKRHRREIDALKDTVEHLKCELKSSSPATPQAAPSLSPVPTAPATVSQSLPQSTVNSQAVNGRERKFNIVLYGMDECPKGTPKSNRLEEDLKNALSVILEVDQSITSHSIRGIHRLGKYSVEARKSRPLLVKFIRATDASSVLSKRRSSIGASVIIKPDMSPSERKREPILCQAAGYISAFSTSAPYFYCHLFYYLLLLFVTTSAVKQK